MVHSQAVPRDVPGSQIALVLVAAIASACGRPTHERVAIRLVDRFDAKRPSREQLEQLRGLGYVK